jgi:hypothetical protein
MHDRRPSRALATSVRLKTATVNSFRPDYDPDSLHDQFGVRFRLVESSKELHRTPFGTTEQFLYCYRKIE